MSDRPARPTKQPVAKVSLKPSAQSGQHPTVKQYRAKLESIDGTSIATDKLDRELEDFLIALKTPVPPKP